MESRFVRKLLLLAGIFIGIWVAVRYLLPLAWPFLLGALLALAAEPAVKRMCVRVKRAVAAGLGVSLTLVLLCSVLSFVGAVAVKEMGVLVRAMPNIGQTAQHGIQLLQDWLITLADKTPDSVRPMLTKTVLDTLGSGTALVSEITARIPNALTSAIGWVSNGALTLGTGVVAGYMISSRLPQLRAAVIRWIPEPWKQSYIPAIRRMRHGLGGWLKAQLKLMGITAAILTVGFFLLKIKFAPLWALLIALVDAVPVLGTGTVLLPWALVRFLQRDMVQGVGLVVIYAVTALVRVVLEPRLVGKHLGLDPLLTLCAFYVGYRIWGFAGMVLAPLVTAAVASVIKQSSP